MSMADLSSPVPLADLENVLAWVDSFKLSRQTKKINRDFSDAVLLAEILRVYYPRLVEMHNYPPRNSQALKLNNWMTLNRKVLKKLRLGLCASTMDQLSNSAPGVIERVLLMVREKIRRDEEINKSQKDLENNLSSGGSYYEAFGDDENILVVPVKTRINGNLEHIQQKVVNYAAYTALKEELKDAKESNELLKQKVEHVDSLLKLKEERIAELQKQLDRKTTRRKDTETFCSYTTLIDPAVAVAKPIEDNTNIYGKTSSVQSLPSEKHQSSSLLKKSSQDLTPKVSESRSLGDLKKVSISNSFEQNHPKTPEILEASESKIISSEILSNDYPIVEKKSSEKIIEVMKVDSDVFQEAITLSNNAEIKQIDLLNEEDFNQELVKEKSFVNKMTIETN